MPPPALSDAMLDSWLLQHFPGRFLDEISADMDVFRFLRALEARGIETVERIRREYLDGGDDKRKPTPEQWEQIDANDELFDALTEE